MKILVADDDKMIRQLLQTTLEKEGHEITLAVDGLEALKIAKDKIFDFLITDIIMPGVEGIEVISEIREIQPKIKVIAISSSGAVGFTSYLTLASTVGASATLKKPFTPSELITILNDLI